MAETVSQSMFIVFFTVYLLGKAEAALLNPVHFSNIRLLKAMQWPSKQDSQAPN